MRWPRFALATLLAGAAVAFAAVGATVAPAGLGAGSAPPPAETTREQRRTGSDAGRAMRSELRRLERAWSDGGGTYGYPFWEKAGQRWRTNEITTPMYREYVTGYRDRLAVGCRLLDQVDVTTDVSEQVRDLALEACERRIDALRAQQRSLDEQIHRAAGDPDIDVAASEERSAEHDAEAVEALQESYRLAREAMNLAQRELDAAGLERLSEDAFI